MKSFKDLNVKPKESTSFKGDKIKISKVFNREIIVVDYKIKESKYEKSNNNCLWLQIILNDNYHVLFTGSDYLIETIKQIKKEDLPFKTTIVEENERYEFT